MARDNITTYNPSEAGQTITYLAAIAANNAQIQVNSGKQIVLAQNGGGASINVTIVTGGTVNGLAIADQVVAVAAGATRIIGPFSPQVYNQPGTDTLYIDVSGNINLAAIQL